LQQTELRLQLRFFLTKIYVNKKEAFTQQKPPPVGQPRQPRHPGEATEKTG
jgi:hypothetical protein